ARPLVSIRTRSKLGAAPRPRSANKVRKVSCRSVRIAQQRQPLPSNTVASLDERSSASSMPTSPNSLTTTAVLAASGFVSNSRINVVLPAPRKPVTTVTGRRAPRGRRCRRPNGLASRLVKGSDIRFQLVHDYQYKRVPAKAGTHLYGSELLKGGSRLSP